MVHRRQIAHRLLQQLPSPAQLPRPAAASPLSAGVLEGTTVLWEGAHRSESGTAGCNAASAAAVDRSAAATRGGASDDLSAALTLAPRYKSAHLYHSIHPAPGSASKWSGLMAAGGVPGWACVHGRQPTHLPSRGKGQA
jgi:hypothetical protein